MLKESITKILITFIISFFIYYWIFILSASYWNSNKFFSESYKHTWNDAYIKNDTIKLSELYSDAEWYVVKNKQICIKEWFYYENQNNYFCKDWIVFIFSYKDYLKSFSDTLSTSWIKILILSIFFSLLNLISLYLYNNYIFKTLKNKSITLQEIDKKLNENTQLYKNYITDITKFDNNPYNNNLWLYNTIYTYYLTSKQHINNILNKLNDINTLIYSKWLQVLSQDFLKKHKLFNEYLKYDKYFYVLNIKNIFFQNTIFWILKILWMFLMINYLILNDISYTTWLFNFFNYLNLKESFSMLFFSWIIRETAVTFLVWKIGFFIFILNIIFYIKNKE